MPRKIQVAVSFDTTGSMFPALAEVRRKVRELARRLFADIQGLEIAIVAHGDYCDAATTYVVRYIDFTGSEDEVADFVFGVVPTYGGDNPECYEFVMRQVRTRLSWDADAEKIFVMIGDEVPHGPTYPDNRERIDWRQELEELTRAGIGVHGVQALGRRHADPFWEEVARATGGFRLRLGQFFQIVDTIAALVYAQAGRVDEYADEVQRAGRMDRSMAEAFDAMSGGAGRPAAERAERPPRARRASAMREADLAAVPAGRFQILHVDEDSPIKQFVLGAGAAFRVGRGFYEFTKTETIQGYKEVVLRDRETGDLYTGERAREMIGLRPGETGRLRPAHLERFQVFVQSTSANRKLIGGTMFLYEVEDWDRAA